MLGDLLWNLTVLENLDGGDVKPQTLDPELVYTNALANGRNVARLRGIGRAARAKRVERERRKRSRRGRFKSGGPPPSLRKS